jgi:ATP-dependent protease ClpP protease subunit
MHSHPKIFNVPPPIATATPWLTVRAECAGPAEILINGTIGKTWWDDSGTAEKEFVDALNKIPAGRSIIIGINSQGGSVKDGLGMYNAIKRRANDITCRIDGYALSIASIVALGGGKVISPKSSAWMIHEPWSVTQGNADDHRRASEMLETHGKMLADIYASETGQTVEAAREAMKQETWFRGSEAIDWGLADEEGNSDVTLNAIDFSSFRRVPAAILNLHQIPAAPPSAGANKKQKDAHMRDQIIALLKKHGVTVADNISDEDLHKLLNETLARLNQTQPQNTNEIAALAQQVTALVAANEAGRRQHITATVQRAVDECRIPLAQKDNWINRALADPTILDDLLAIEPKPPGAQPAASIVTVAPEIKNITGEVMRTNAMERALVLNRYREKIGQVLNTNTIDTNLKRVVILDTMVRDFARRILPLRVFSTSFTNVILQGTDEVVIPYYALAAAASTDWVAATGYVAGNTAVSAKKITVNKRKYQGVEFTSSEFRRQPYLSIEQSMKMVAEKLGYDVFTDVWSIVTAAKYGAAAVTSSAIAFDVDDVADLKLACDVANWPEVGRGLIIDSAHDRYLMRDGSLGLANYGQAGAITQGKVPVVLGYNYYPVPNLPDNSENLSGAAVFPSAAGVATAPIAPHPELNNVISYDVAVDPDTGIALEYKMIPDGQKDKVGEYIECNYGYEALLAAALKRVCKA